MPQFDSRRDAEDGSTFVEVLAALAILSVVAAVLWFAAGGAADRLRAAVATARGSIQLLHLQAVLWRAAERIHPSYWVGKRLTDSITREEERVRVPNLDGDCAEWLEVTIGEGVTIATSTGRRHVFSLVDVSAVEVLEYEGVVYGLMLMVDGRGEGGLRVVAEFGATAIPSIGTEASL
jgi:type II secretory pathway pseudopilin PulG